MTTPAPSHTNRGGAGWPMAQFQADDTSQIQPNASSSVPIHHRAGRGAWTVRWPSFTQSTLPHRAACAQFAGGADAREPAEPAAIDSLAPRGTRR